MSPPIQPGRQASPTDGSAIDLSVWTLLQRVGIYIRDQPRSVVPFTIAGLMVAVADWIRSTDPIPMAVPDSFRKTVSVQYSLVPMGTQRTVRSVDALINLRGPYLLGAVALELFVLLAVAVAGYLTLQLILDTSGSRRVAARYGLLVVAVGFVPRWLGTAQLTLGNLLVGLVALVLLSAIAVRLFLLPGLVVGGESVGAALRQSRRRSRGNGWTLFGLIVIIGISSWGLARVPLAGGFLSTAIVGPVHALSVGMLIQRTSRPSVS